jgi:hypothetical protein
LDAVFRGAGSRTVNAGGFSRAGDARRSEENAQCLS